MSHFGSAEEAIPEYFEPLVPCRQFETRPCVDLSFDDEDRFRKQPCAAGNCTRHPNLDKEALMTRKKKEPISSKYVHCAASLESKDDEGHIHSCMGEAGHNGDHYCSACMRWFGKAKRS